MIRPLDAWMLARLLCGLEHEHQEARTGEHDHEHEHEHDEHGHDHEHGHGQRNGQGERQDHRRLRLRPLVLHLAGLPAPLRQAAWDGFLCGKARHDRERLILAVADQDPAATPPADADAEAEEEAGPNRPTWAHLGHLSGLAAPGGRYLWSNWLVRGHFNLLTSDPKVGKTHLALDLARRIWVGEAWPDGQPATLQPGTATVWICGDRHQDELRERAPAFGLPVEAVWLNAVPENPYGGCNLDEPRTHESLRGIVEHGKPGLVIIDTVWRATNRRLCREDDANAVVDPLITLAQECNVAILGLMHLSKDSETLGRRLDGVARSILKMIQPPGAPLNRRRLECRGNFKEPPPLGVTLKDNGCDFDANPPGDNGSDHRGRPSRKRSQAAEFLHAALGRQNDQLAKDLADEWIKNGGNGRTFWRAVSELCDSGELVSDGGKGTGKRMILHQSRADSSSNGPPDP